MDINEPIKVLLLEDNPLDVELIKQELFSKLEVKIQFHWVIHEEEFIQSLCEFQPDIILSDYNLPKYNGLKALAYSIKHDPLLPFIIVTGSLSEEMAADSIKAGAWDYVVKDRLQRLPSAFENSLKRKEEKLQQKFIQDELNKTEKRLQSQLKISQYKTDSIQELLDVSLQESIHLTESKIGFFNFYSEEKKQFTLNTWSKETMEKCSIVDPQSVQNLDTVGCWGEAVRQRKAFFINDFSKKNKYFKGIPEGHVKLEKFLTVPIFRDNQIVAVVGVANKASDYTENDILHLNLLMASALLVVEKLQYNLEINEAKELAERNEAYYRTIFNNTGNATCIIEEDSMISLTNPGFEKLTGFSKDEIDGKISWTELIAPEDLEQMKAYHAERRDKQKSPPKQYEFSFVHKKGKYKRGYINVDIIPGTKKSVASVLDISERVVMEDQLKESEEKYRKLVENIEVGIGYVDKNERFTYINNAGALIFGESQDNMTGASLKKHTSSSAYKIITNETSKRIKGETSIYEVQVQRKSGEERLVRIFATPEFDNQGFYIGTFGIFSDITDNVKLQEQVKESEEKFRLISTSAQDAIIMIDNDGNIIYWNPSAEKTLGYTSVEVIGKNLHKLLAPKKMYNLYQQKFPTFQKTGKGNAIGKISELLAIKKNGEVIPVELSLSKMKISDKWGAVGILRDISIRKKAEIELKKSEEKFRNLFNVSTDPILIVDRSGKIIEVNDVAVKTFGYSIEEFRKLNVSDIDVLLGEDQINASLNELNEKLYQRFETIVLSKDKREIPVDVSARLIEYEGKKASISIARDITERKLAEKELRESELKLKTILNEIQAGVIIIDKETKTVTDLNPAAAKMIGYKKNEIVGKSCFDLICPFEICQLETDTKICDGKEGEIVTALGNNLAIIKNVAQVELQGRKYIIESFVDITEQKKLQQGLIDALERAKESDQLKSAFLATMSHELRTPLNAVIGFSDLIMDGLDQDNVTEMARLINQNGNELLKIIESIFEISMLQSKLARVETHIFSVVELFASVKQVLNTQLLKEGKTNIATFYQPDPNKKYFEIKTDKNKLLQILSNFISNAVKFTDEGEIEYGFKVHNNDIEFFIRDSGIGIPEEKQQIIFDEFRQVDDSHTRKHGGLGLGLALTKELAKILDGEVKVQSRKGNGSTFCFMLKDAIVVSIEKTSIEKISTSGFNFTGKTILVAEDMESNYLYLRRILQKTHAKILWAQNGIDAVNMIRQNPSIDLVLMDIRMPGLNGYEATKQIKAMNPDIFVIAQTAFAMLRDKDKAIKSGCDDYLAKPIKQDVLLNTIKKFLDPA